jgi:hypothetical protein
VIASSDTQYYNYDTKKNKPIDFGACGLGSQALQLQHKTIVVGRAQWVVARRC